MRDRGVVVAGRKGPHAAREVKDRAAESGSDECAQATGGEGRKGKRQEDLGRHRVCGREGLRLGNPHDDAPIAREASRWRRLYGREGFTVRNPDQGRRRVAERGDELRDSGVGVAPDHARAEELSFAVLTRAK